MDSIFVNSGRRVAIEAAIMPRFISSLCFFSATEVYLSTLAETYTADTMLTKLASKTTVKARVGISEIWKDSQVTSAAVFVYKNAMRRTEKDAVLEQP